MMNVKSINEGPDTPHVIFRPGWVSRGFRDSQASDADAIGIGLVYILVRFGTGSSR